MEEWSKIIEEIPIYTIEASNLKEIERIAIEQDVTSYDASYISITESKKPKTGN